MMNDICEINRIAPLRGFRLRGDLFRRALPYAIDLRAFSPINDEKDITECCTHRNRKAESLINNRLTSLNTCGNHKAESLVVNSVGQRPTERIVSQTEAPKGRNQ